MEGDLTCGGKHTIQCTDNVWWNCAPETAIILLSNVTLKNSIKGGKKEKCKNLRYIVGWIFTTESVSVIAKVKKYSVTSTP